MSQTAVYNNCNQIVGTGNATACGYTGSVVSGGTLQNVSYDAAGNMTSDGVNQLAYDAEGRVCASYNPGTGSYSQYVYDADGNRVAKLSVVASGATLGCAQFSGQSLPANTAVVATYVVGLQGEQLTELDGGGNWQHTNVYANGMLVATYRNDAGDLKANGQLRSRQSPGCAYATRSTVRHGPPNDASRVPVPEQSRRAAHSPDSSVPDTVLVAAAAKALQLFSQHILQHRLVEGKRSY
ncbi:MAG: hypothetical protein KGK08_05880 [Acidobacteriota bacterium]|nr:hypothetical protein [Acidobacteriota bacterium]